MRPVNEKLAADLLEAGKQEFLEKGFQGASMRGIASRLSVTTGALYRYYTDKESLGNISANCDGCMARLADMYQDYIDGKKEIREINMKFNARYVRGDMDKEEKKSCPM